MTKAVIFDMDGVISDTQKLHAAVESELLARRGITMTPEEITGKYTGTEDHHMFSEVFSMHGVEEALEVVLAEKWPLIRKRAAEGIEAIDGVTELIQALRGQDYQVGVASSSPLDFIGEVLGQLNLTELFHALTSGEEVEEGKPDPAIFLLAAERLEVAPQYCLVIEDGRPGMEGAKEAGMKCIGLVEDTRGDYPADYLVDSLRYVSPEVIEQLLATA